MIAHGIIKSQYYDPLQYPPPRGTLRNNYGKVRGFCTLEGRQKRRFQARCCLHCQILQFRNGLLCSGMAFKSCPRFLIRRGPHSGNRCRCRYKWDITSRHVSYLKMTRVELRLIIFKFVDPLPRATMRVALLRDWLWSRFKLNPLNIFRMLVWFQTS